MPLLKVTNQENATGRVAEIYGTMMDKMGFIPNAFKIFSSSEHVLGTQVGNLAYFMRHKTLGGKLLAFVRVLVSEQEHCEYCITVNSHILLQYGVLPDTLAEIKLDPSKAPLEEKELALLLFVLKVVKDSNSVQQSDVDALRNLGWTDADILDATYHGATQMGMSQVFNAFKIEVDM